MTTWGAAMGQALYGPAGFYHRDAPDAHFRTSVNASPLFASTLVELARAVDEALGSPEIFDIVDVGAGDGQLLVELLGALPNDIADRVRPTAVEIRSRPDGLPARVIWASTLPAHVTGLVIANEYLDNVPCDVVQVADHRVRQVEVKPPTGGETLGGAPDGCSTQWLDTWWPLRDEGGRAEVGIERDAAWGAIVTNVTRGVAVAIEYGHTNQERATGAFNGGTMTGYRDGHQVAPIPDGSCDITAHVAMDACQQAGVEAGATASALIRQADALRALGLSAQRPALDLAHTDPQGYVEALSRASHAGELLDPASLGSFWWLLQAKGCTPKIAGIELA